MPEFPMLVQNAVAKSVANYSNPKNALLLYSLLSNFMKNKYSYADITNEECDS
jgi:alanine-alpha-ketoisovalerate/valine-pyruvate aminotransferase